jgi:hypothetical protein
MALLREGLTRGQLRRCEVCGMVAFQLDDRAVIDLALSGWGPHLCPSCRANDS